MLKIVAFLCLVISQSCAVEISNGQFEATTLTNKPIDTSFQTGEVDDWTYFEAGLSNDDSKVGDEVLSGNQFAFVDPEGSISQKIELELGKNYMISWADASVYNTTSYLVTLSKLTNGQPIEYHTIKSAFSISAGQHWSNRVVFVTPLRSAQFQLSFSSTSDHGMRFYIDKVAIAEVSCESKDMISDGDFDNSPPSSVWQKSSGATLIAPVADSRAQLESGSYFAFCVPLYVGTYTFGVSVRLDSDPIEESDLSLTVSAAEHATTVLQVDDLDSQISSDYKIHTYTLQVPTQGIHFFAFKSKIYKESATYAISHFTLSARIGTDFNTGLPIYTGVSTTKIMNSDFDDETLTDGDERPTNMDDETYEVWMFNGFGGISADHGNRLPSNQKGFEGQYAFLEPSGKLAQGIHLNANTDVVISFLTIIKDTTDSSSFNVKITTPAINSNGDEANYPVYFSNDHKATNYVRRSFVFFTTVTSGFYMFSITSMADSVILFDKFTLEVVICDTRNPYSFNNINWEVNGAMFNSSNVVVAPGEAAGQCVVASEPSDVKFSIKIKTTTTSLDNSFDSTPLIVGIDSIFGGNAQVFSYTGASGSGYDNTLADETLSLSFKKWDFYTTGAYPLVQASTDAGFAEPAPPTPSKYFVYAYVDAREGTESQPADKSYEINTAITATERVSNVLTVNHLPFGGSIIVPYGVIGIADVVFNNSVEAREATYTTSAADESQFLEQPLFDPINNVVSFKVSPTAEGAVLISIVNNENDAVTHLDLAACKTQTLNAQGRITSLATCIRVETHPRDVFVRKDVVYRTNLNAELQPGDWFKNRVLDCECKLIDAPAKQPKYIWPDN